MTYLDAQNACSKMGLTMPELISDLNGGYNQYPLTSSGEALATHLNYADLVWTKTNCRSNDICLVSLGNANM